MNEKSQNPEIELIPRRAALVDGHANKVEVLVRLLAVEAPAELPPRPPLNLALVLDRSGSMAGRPLQEAVRAARNVVAGLDPRDRLAIVAFHSDTEVLVSSRPVDHQAPFSAALSRIGPGGQTALFDGWLQGASQVAPHTGPAAVSKVLLLTDGQANQGKTGATEIAEDCARLADTGVFTTTFGLGNHFDEMLLGAMAESGRGKAYYGESAEDLHEPFQEELGLLANLFTRGPRLRLETSVGARLKVRNLYRQDGDGLYLLPDLPFGGEVWALVEVELPQAALVQEARPLVLRAKAQFIRRDGSPGETETAVLRLEKMPPEAFAALAESSMVARRAEELRAADLQEEARRAAQNGDWVQVDALLAQARAEAANNPWVQEVIGGLEAYAKQRHREAFSKAGRYSSMKFRGRQKSRHELESYDPEAERGAEGFFKRKPKEGKSHGKDPDPKS